MTHETTVVFPSSRAIRDFQSRISEDVLFLPNFLTMSEFVSNLCIVEDYRYVDDDTRSLLLLEASNFTLFSRLEIDRNFFTFTKNANYIFKFFEELSAELIPIASLDIADVYAEYEEHIAILTQLHKNYENLCHEKKILDKIFLPKLYKINHLYLQNNKNIKIHVAGHLTNFECQLLEEALVDANITLVFSTTKFNKKMQKKFYEWGFELEEGYEYTLSLNTRSVLACQELRSKKEISCESFSEPLLQVAYVQKKVYEFISKGYDANRIAIILPDENFATMLKLFDEKSNFNFAMGEPFSGTILYQKIDAAIQAIEIDSKENEARLERLGKEVYKELYDKFYKNANEVDVLVLLESLNIYAGTKIEKKIYDEEVFRFKNILPFMQEMNLKSLLHLFMQRIASRTLDDVRGGKITVMGVLETRAVSFDGVIIVDFSDTNVPKKSDKDMFLNTKIRENANLPTMQDRENLQKHYYNMLFHNAQEVALCYVKSAQSNPSRFLKELHINEKSNHKELDYANILFHRQTVHAKEETSIILDYSFKNQKMSTSKFKTYLSCKRKYYYKYIQNIKNHTIPKDMPQEWEIGTHIHTALSNLYKKHASYTSYDKLKKDLEYELDAVCGSSEMEKYLISMYKKILEPFCVQEIQRFQEGWHVLSCEENFECDFAGIKLIGQIDRIDKKENEILVLDYKTGSYPLYTEKTLAQANDFQLEFYYLLSRELGGNVSCGYYDLKDSKIVPEALLSQKLGILESNIKDMLLHERFDFAKCEDLKHCIYCEYSLICGRN